jgi:large subunit ribosomal protein L10
VATEELRGALRQDPEGENEYHVIKNSVLKHALKDSELEVLDEHLKGPTACAVSYGDPVALAKVLVEFQKKHDVFELKGGFLDGKALDTGEIATLATLPNLQELRGKLVGLLVAPATKLVRLLNEPGSQLARLVEARRADLEGSGGE